MDIRWLIFGAMGIAFIVVMLLTEGCKPSDMAQMNPLDLPPARADDPPVKRYDYACGESLRRQAHECRTACIVQFDLGKPTACVRRFESEHSGIYQTLMETCEACEPVCGLLHPDDQFQWSSATGDVPPCKVGQHTMCGYTGPDPKVECVR